jgi:hypothetical protein
VFTGMGEENYTQTICIYSNPESSLEISAKFTCDNGRPMTSCMTLIMMSMTDVLP